VSFWLSIVNAKVTEEGTDEDVHVLEQDTAATCVSEPVDARLCTRTASEVGADEAAPLDVAVQVTRWSCLSAPTVSTT
jgi:hypothetical protein